MSLIIDVLCDQGDVVDTVDDKGQPCVGLFERGLELRIVIVSA